MITDLNEYKNYIKNKKVLIWGLGLQGGGISSTLFFARNGAVVRITDLKTKDQLVNSLSQIKSFDIDYSLGGHKQSDFEWADIVVINQDIFNKSPDSPFLKYIFDTQKEFETEMGLFFKLCEKSIIGVTGSRGKTTTTIAIAEMLKKAGKKVFLGGNITDSNNLARIEEANESELVVLELSNYQLHGINFVQKSPQIAVITSISADHLVSYKSMQDYLKDKKAICRYQSPNDYLIIKQNDQYSHEFIKQSSAKLVQFDKNTLPLDWQIQINGQHNRENMGAVYQVGRILAIPEEIIQKAVCEFQGVAFRLQKIAQIKGISFINDTTATTPTAAEIALKSFPENKIIWIGGGSTKKLPLDDLVNTIDTRVKNIILLSGTGTEEIFPLLKNNCNNWDKRFAGIFDNLSSAFYRACELAQIDDVILLSPGFASFGMFINEFDRGRQFNQLITSYSKSATN